MFLFRRQWSKTTKTENGIKKFTQRINKHVSLTVTAFHRVVLVEGVKNKAAFCVYAKRTKKLDSK